MKSSQKWPKNEKYSIGPHISKIATQKGLKVQSSNFFQIIRRYIWVIFSKVCTLWVISVHAFFGQLQHHNLYFWWENNKNMSFPLKKNCFIVPWYTKLKYQILTWQKCPYRYLAKVGPPLQNLCNLTIGFIGGTIISVSIITITSASKKRNINYCLAIIA